MSNEIQNHNNVQTQTKQKKNRGTTLVLLLIVFLILFLLTTAVLGSRLNELATRDKYTVELGLGDLEHKIELFRIAYSNTDGEITVQGINGETVVAPGTEMNHDVRLRNSGDKQVDFLMLPDIDFLTGDEVPVEFQMIDAYGNYILGGPEAWVSSADMNSLAHRGSIHPGEVFTYHISWRWAFDVSNEQDALDTYLGSQDGEVYPGVVVSITTEAMEDVDSAVYSNHFAHMVGEGFGCCWCCYLVWFLLLAVIGLLIWILMLTRKYNRLESRLEESGEFVK